MASMSELLEVNMVNFREIFKIKKTNFVALRLQYVCVCVCVCVCVSVCMSVLP